MTVPYYGDFPVNHTGVVIPFNTFTSDDPSASVTIGEFAAADVHIHKNGSLTQRASAAGVAIDIDVDAITGGHWVTIDLSDNTDAGFYAAGSEISVRIEGTTVDAATVNAFIGTFSIERAGGVLALLKAGTVKVDLETIKTRAITCGAGVTVGVYVGGTGAAALASEVTAERMATLTDWINGGRLDLLLDAIKVVTDAQTATGLGLSAIPWNAAWDAEVQSEVADALNAAMPAAPTADSLNQFIQQLKWVMVNQMSVTEANGNVEGLKDDDLTAAYTIAAAFTSAAGITVRKRLEA